MGEKNPDVKGKPSPIEQKPKRETSDAVKRFAGKTAINGK